MSRLFVGNIPFECNSDDVMERLGELGIHALDFELIHDRDTGGSKGFGFLELDPKQNEKEAITLANGQNIVSFSGRSRILTVSIATPRPEITKGRMVCR